MKKIIFTALVGFFMVHTMSAQLLGSNTSEQLHFGLKVGANVSNIYDSQGEEYDASAKVGLAGGAFLSIPLGAYLGIQPEVLFSQKGFVATSTILGADVTMTRTTNYIDVPLFLAIKPNEMLTLLVGPQYSFLTKQNDKFTNPIADFEVNEDFETDNIRKNTLCLVGGVDFNLSNFVIGARVGMDMFNNNGDGTTTTPRYKNVWAQATVGFRL